MNKFEESKNSEDENKKFQQFMQDQNRDRAKMLNGGEFGGP